MSISFCVMGAINDVTGWGEVEWIGANLPVYQG